MIHIQKYEWKITNTKNKNQITIVVETLRKKNIMKMVTISESK